MTLEKTLFDEQGIDKTYNYISTDKKCDVLIVGGGICGALAAYFQIKRGNKVIVVDKNIVGYENSKKCLGMLRKNMSISEYSKIKNQKVSYKIKKLYEEAFFDFEKIIADMEMSESIKEDVKKIGFDIKDMIYYSERTVSKYNMYKDYENIIKENELKKDMIKYIEAHKYLNLKCGIKEKQSVATFNPYIFTTLLFKYLVTCKNVEVYEHTEIEDIVNIEDIVEAVTNNKFKIYAKKIIITSGTHSIKNMKESEVMIDVYKSFNIVTEPLLSVDEKETDFVAKSVIEPFEYITFTDDNRIIINAADIKETNKIVDDKYVSHIANGKYKGILKLLKQIFILPDDLKITNCYSNTYLKTKDDLPIIDEFESMPNVYVIMPSGKCNLNYGVMGAKMLSDITKDFHIKDMTIFRMDR